MSMCVIDFMQRRMVISEYTLADWNLGYFGLIENRKIAKIMHQHLFRYDVRFGSSLVNSKLNHQKNFELPYFPFYRHFHQQLTISSGSRKKIVW